MKKRKLRIANKFRFTVFMVIILLLLMSTFATVLGANVVLSAQTPKYITVNVQPGDTLWMLAQKYSPSNIDKRRIIYEISLLNNLDKNYIYPGQVLKIPVFNDN